MALVNISKEVLRHLDQQFGQVVLVKDLCLDGLPSQIPGCLKAMSAGDQHQVLIDGDGVRQENEEDDPCADADGFHVF